jgi:hypothetical protein
MDNDMEMGESLGSGGLLNAADDDETIHQTTQQQQQQQQQNQYSGSLSQSSSSSKFNISPNRPNAAVKLELKSIERPRSHSPNMPPKPRIGLEEYVELAAAQSVTTPPSTAPKITMNLKMDDLLASSKTADQYQALDDHSFMTGDRDDSVVYPSTKQRVSISGGRTSKRTSIDRNFDGDENGGFRAYNNNDDDYSNATAAGAEDNDADTEDETSSNAPHASAGNQNFNDDENLKYTYTAVYRKDEATGSFQEKSQIIIEPASVIPSALTKARAAPPPRPVKPPAPPPLTTNSSYSAYGTSDSFSNNTASYGGGGGGGSLPKPPTPPPPTSQAQEYNYNYNNDSNNNSAYYGEEQHQQQQVRLYCFFFCLLFKSARKVCIIRNTKSSRS